MGWVLLQGGVTKLITYLDGNPETNWTAAGYLANAIPEGNPFGELWLGMAGSPMVDILVMWGLTLTGLGLILGAFVRWNAFWGAVMMLMFWAAALQGGITAGLPIAHGWVVDDHMVYAALLFGLGAIGAGRILGPRRLPGEPRRRPEQRLAALLHGVISPGQTGSPCQSASGSDRPGRDGLDVGPVR